MRTPFLATFALLASQPIMGCVVDVPDEALLMNESSAVFEAVLLEERPIGPSFSNTGIVVSQTFDVEVRRVWKGDVTAHVTVSRMDLVEQCVGSRAGVKYEPRLFAVGQRLIIYARRIGPRAYSMLRLGYFVIGEGSQPSSLEKTYGEGVEPKKNG